MNKVRNELFHTIMDENGKIDSYGHCKAISRIAFEQDVPHYSPFGDFLNYCLDNGIDPSLELIRIEEDMKEKQQQPSNQVDFKLYSINNAVYKALPKKISKDIIDGLRRMKTNTQPIILSGTNSFVSAMEKVIQNFLVDKSIDILELKLENSYERNLAISMAHYYKLRTHENANGKFRITRAKNLKDVDIIPSMNLIELANLLKLEEQD